MNLPSDLVMVRRFPHRWHLRWAVFDPPLRNRAVPACCEREVRCRICGGTVLGITRDPVDAILIAWRHAKQTRRAKRLKAATASP